jgi:hypothetical protein
MDGLPAGHVQTLSVVVKFDVSDHEFMRDSLGMMIDGHSDCVWIWDLESGGKGWEGRWWEGPARKGSRSG